MRAAILASAIVALSSIVTARPSTSTPEKRLALFTGKPYQIRDLALETSIANTTLYFIVHDPDPLTNATTSCRGSWTSSSLPQGGYIECIQDRNFGWNLYSYTNATNFVLGLEHSFTDPSIGPYPYDEVTTFAKTNVNETVLHCTSANHNAVKRCKQPKGAVLSASIYATAA